MEKQHWLINRFTQFQDRPSIVWHDTPITYAEVLFSIRGWLEILNRQNISKGDVVAICGACTPKTCALLIALFINESIVLPIASATQSLKDKYIQIAEVKYSIEMMEDGNHSSPFAQIFSQFNSFPE